MVLHLRSIAYYLVATHHHLLWQYNPAWFDSLVMAYKCCPWIAYRNSEDNPPMVENPNIKTN